MNNIARYAAIILVLVSISCVCYAQPDNPNDDADAVPLGGLEWLLGAGALWGAKKWADYRKKS